MAGPNTCNNEIDWKRTIIPYHQISLARLMMLVCSIKKKKTKPSGDITITIEDALSSLS